MRSLLKSKKGDLTDGFIFLITIFVFAIGLFIMAFIVPQVANGLKTAGMNNTSEGTNAINQMSIIGTSTMNNGFMILFVGLIMSIMITSFMVRTHPIFLFLYIFFLVITLLVSFYIGNAYHQFADNPLFADTLNNTGFITLVMNHIAEISLAVGALSIIIVFAKFSTFGGTQQF
jgi:hypothetical protein